MFTRFDSERNSKVMKRAVNEDRLDSDKYKQAVQTMDAYVEIPSKRLAHLARKYSHHVQMREIEGTQKEIRWIGCILLMMYACESGGVYRNV